MSLRSPDRDLKLLTQEASWSRCPNCLHWLLFKSSVAALIWSPPEWRSFSACLWEPRLPSEELISAADMFSLSVSIAARGHRWGYVQTLTRKSGTFSSLFTTGVWYSIHIITRSRSPAPPSPHSTKPCDTWVPSLGAETCPWPNLSTPLFSCWGPSSQPDLCPDLPDETYYQCLSIQQDSGSADEALKVMKFNIWCLVCRKCQEI